MKGGEDRNISRSRCCNCQKLEGGFVFELLGSRSLSLYSQESIYLVSLKAKHAPLYLN